MSAAYQNVVIVIGSSPHATHRMVGSVAVSLARHSPVPFVIGHRLAVQQAPARTGDPPHADRYTTVRSDHSNFCRTIRGVTCSPREALSGCS